MELLYKEIMERVLDTGSPVQFADIFNDQYYNPQTEYPYNMPAVFIELDGDYQQAGAGMQVGNMTLRAHVVQQSFADTFATQVPYTNNGGIEVYAILGQIHKLLQNFAPSNASRLMRTDMPQKVQHERLIIHIVTYIFAHYDQQAGDIAIYTEPVEPDITIEKT